MPANSNPHDNTYNSTTFSGPVKAGSRRQPVPTYDRDTVPGTIAVTALPNSGYAICSQSAAVNQFGLGVPPTVSDITLPPGSMIVSIQYIVTVAYTGSVKDLSLVLDPGGVAEAGTWLTATAPGPTVSAVGVYNIGPRTTSSDTVRAWRNISDPTYVTGARAGVSLDVKYGSTNTGDGRAIVTINYIPEFNFPLA